MKKKIIVVGGGTAGWLTALYTELKLKDSVEITVIESSEIGILGAGEGTTPHFSNVFDALGIDKTEIFKKAKGTLKQGIKFTNWQGIGTEYFHPFGGNNEFIPSYETFKSCMSEGLSLDNICLSAQTSKLNKLAARYDTQESNVIFDGDFAYHFDAIKIAELLKDVGISRNIHVVDNIVDTFQQDKEGNITDVYLKDGSKLSCDFIFDCSGFHRLIIGKLFNTEWISSSTALPADKALPFFLPVDESYIPPYTEAIAMKCGWIWKIPLQDRYGCGYVFDSSYTTIEQVKQEITDNFKNVSFPREHPFTFNPGYYKKTWVNNCIAIGLSSGFFEPLEATSIWTSIFSLDNLFQHFLPGITNKKLEYRESYNNHLLSFSKNIEGFLQLHYIAGRSDTAFWKEFCTKNIIDEKNIKIKNCKIPYDVSGVLEDYNKNFQSLWCAGGTGLLSKSIFNEDRNKNISAFKERLTVYAKFSGIDHLTFLNQYK